MTASEKSDHLASLIPQHTVASLEKATSWTTHRRGNHGRPMRLDNNLQLLNCPIVFHKLIGVSKLRNMLHKFHGLVAVTATSPSQIQNFAARLKDIAHPLDLETSLSVIHLVYA
jgi:hypothetical protein